MKKIIRKFLSKFSKYVQIYDNAFDLIKVINFHKINLVIDIGASTGEYGKMLRRFGYENQIFSIEPVTKSYNRLEKICKFDNKWFCKQYIISKLNDTKVKINVSEDYDNSSILIPTDLHLKNHSGSKLVYTEIINKKTLDDFINEEIKLKDNMMLKIDTQGSENDILESGILSLSKFKLVQIELSLQKLYSNQKLWIEIIHLMREKNFDTWSIFPGYKKKDNGQLLQMDMIFYKK